MIKTMTSERFIDIIKQASPVYRVGPYPFAKGKRCVSLRLLKSQNPFSAVADWVREAALYQWVGSDTPDMANEEAEALVFRVLDNTKFETAPSGTRFLYWPNMEWPAEESES